MLMKFVYFGTSEFAVPPLVAIASHVCLVVSQPDRPSGRGLKLTPSPVKQKALELGIKVLTPEKARDSEFVEFIQSLEADALIVAAYGQILSPALLAAAKNGGINLHGSILPMYRGAAPIQRAIQNGDLETGVTLMQMSKGMDTGDIINIVQTPIGSDETYGELLTRLSHLAAIQIAEWAERIASGNYPRKAQNEEWGTYASKIERSETELYFHEPEHVAYDRFRAFTPSPACFLNTSKGRIKLSQVRLRAVDVEQPGTVISVSPLLVGVGTGALELVALQPEGKPKMSGEAWANGQRIKVGDSLMPDSQ